ncbi:YtzI protein [Niallia oryzisoli]|uniref:YtzI protein n=1 Tax=Niallia oryzisoli TaxID=1737571 RepID=UPI0037369885
MVTVLIISIIIIFLVLIVSLKVTKSAYQYKHTIDPPAGDSNDASHDKKTDA